MWYTDSVVICVTWSECSDRCLISVWAADVCHSSADVRHITPTVDDVDVKLTDLQPDQLYHISITSISAVSTQSDAEHLRLKTKAVGLTGGLVALLVIGVLLFIVLMIAAISCLVRYVFTCRIFVLLVSRSGSGSDSSASSGSGSGSGSDSSASSGSRSGR